MWLELQVSDSRKLGEFLTYKKDRSGEKTGMFVIDGTGAVAVEPCSRHVIGTTRNETRR